MAVRNNGDSTGPDGVTGRGLRSGQSGNLGPAPFGDLQRLSRPGDGRDTIDFNVAMLTGDTKALSLRRVTLRDRLAAAPWLGEGDGGGALGR